MNIEEKIYWVSFSAFAEIGIKRLSLLIVYFGSVKRAYEASESQLLATGLNIKIVDKFLIFRKAFDIDSYILRLDKLGIKTIGLDDTSYPLLLKEIVDTPMLIYAKYNDIKIFEQKAIAIVGTRQVSAYGKEVTQKITKDLVEKGFVIVSGLARGVDRVVHETTINNGGKTIAVLGTGLDLIYPPEHQFLAEEIVKSGGALVTEFPLDTKLDPKNFPQRNRIISGLSLGVVVTEAAERSGSLITASFAAEQGREVFAVPGPITSFLSAGTAALIKKGAKLVSNINDIIEELNVS